MSDDSLLRIEEAKRKDAKWNLFRFQDHLLTWIYTSAEHFMQRDYPSAFEALTIVYTDTFGFFNKEEDEKLKGMFAEAQKANNDYISYNVNYIRNKVKQQAYLPPRNIYAKLLTFRQELIKAMIKHQLLIPQVNKSEVGAGEN